MDWSWKSHIALHLGSAVLMLEPQFESTRRARRWIIRLRPRCRIFDDQESPATNAADELVGRHGMNPGLQQRLRARHPRIRVPRCEHGDGWWQLLDALLTVCDRQWVEPTIAQITEKFGGLTIYVGTRDDYLDGAVAAASERSRSTCERSGLPGSAHRVGGWRATLSPEWIARGLDDRVREAVRVAADEVLAIGPVVKTSDWQAGWDAYEEEIERRIDPVTGGMRTP